MILDRWMPQHHQYMPPDAQWIGSVSPPPPPPMVCPHQHPEWFGYSIDPLGAEAREYFKSAEDIADRDPHTGWDPLQKACQSLIDTIFIPTTNCGTNALLYLFMRDHPELMISVYMNSKGGNFYLRFACKSCQRATGFHQPQTEVGILGFNPRGANGKDLKRLPHVQASLRAFIAEVTGSGTPMEVPFMCRHLHQQSPSCAPPLALPCPHGWSPELPGAGLDPAATPTQPQILGHIDTQTESNCPVYAPSCASTCSTSAPSGATSAPSGATSSGASSAPSGAPANHWGPFEDPADGQQ